MFSEEKTVVLLFLYENRNKLLTNWSIDYRLKEKKSKTYRPKRGDTMGYQLTEAEERLAEILWKNVPMTSAELVKICGEEMDWKKSTTYTMLKKLEQKGVFVNEKGMIRAEYTKEEWQAQESRQFVKDSFGGSLPKFLTAFAKGKGLTAKEVEEMKKLIETYEEG